MIPALIFLLLSAAAGALLVRAVWPAAEGDRLAGLALLMGPALPGLILLLLSVAGIGWSRVSLLVSLAVLALAAGGVAHALRPGSPPGAAPARQAGARVAPAMAPPDTQEPGGRGRPPGRPPTAGAGGRWSEAWAIPIDLVTLLLVAGYALFATVAPAPEYDFIGVWGGKAQIFFEHGGIDWDHLENPWNQHAQADYPPLLTLAYAAMAVLRGSWDDRWVGLLLATLAAGVLLLVRHQVRRETGSRLYGSLAAAALAPAALSPYLGLAEGPLIAWAGAGILLLRSALRDMDEGALLPGAVLLGFAGLTKNEGMTWAAAAVLAALWCSRRRVHAAARLWPALALPALWLALRLVHDLPQTYLARGNVLQRVLDRLRDPAPLLDAVAAFTLGHPFLWCGIGLGLLVGLPGRFRAERFLLATLAIQVYCVLAAYLATPLDLSHHFRWSWDRVMSQFTLLLGFLALTTLFPRLRGPAPRLR